MDNIKVGDRVVCIDDITSTGCLVKGEVYKVIKLYDRGVYLEGIKIGFLKSRFEIIKVYRDSKLARFMLGKVEGEDGYIWTI